MNLKGNPKIDPSSKGRQELMHAQQLDQELYAQPSRRKGDAEKISKIVEGEAPKAEAVGIDDFEEIQALGEGSFGAVSLYRKVRGSDNVGGVFAVKAQNKALAAAKGATQNMIDERNIVHQLTHPFIIALKYAFESSTTFYLVLSYVGGGTLQELLTQHTYDLLSNLLNILTFLSYLAGDCRRMWSAFMLANLHLLLVTCMSTG
jgi:serine/threonine protein kinase